MSKALFEEEFEEEEVQSNEGGSTESGLKHDKIFQNDYNTGNLDFEEFGPPKVDQEFIDAHMESSYDSANYYAKMQNMERVDEFFKSSEIGQVIGQKKKIPKQLIPRLYLSMKDCFSKDELSESEFFIIIAEYFGVSYEVFYENIPAIYREALVRELDNKYSVLKKKGIRKLF